MDLNRPDYHFDLFLPSSIVLDNQVSCSSQHCSTSTSSAPPKREIKGARRVRNACLQCRERKIRCSRTYPCKGCISRGDGPACDWQGGFPSGNISAYQQRAIEQRREVNELNERLHSLKAILSGSYLNLSSPRCSPSILGQPTESDLNEALFIETHGQRLSTGPSSAGVFEAPVTLNNSRRASACENQPPNSATSYCTKFSTATGSSSSVNYSAEGSTSNYSPFTSNSLNTFFRSFQDGSGASSHSSEKRGRYRSWRLIREAKDDTSQKETNQNLELRPKTSILDEPDASASKKPKISKTRTLLEINDFSPVHSSPAFENPGSYDCANSFLGSLSNSSHQPSSFASLSFEVRAPISEPSFVFSEQNKLLQPLPQAPNSQDYMVFGYESIFPQNQYQDSLNVPDYGYSSSNRNLFVGSPAQPPSHPYLPELEPIQYTGSRLAEQPPQVMELCDYPSPWNTGGDQGLKQELSAQKKERVVDSENNCMLGPPDFEIALQYLR